MNSKINEFMAELTKRCKERDEHVYINHIQLNPVAYEIHIEHQKYLLDVSMPSWAPILQA